MADVSDESYPTEPHKTKHKKTGMKEGQETELIDMAMVWTELHRPRRNGTIQV